MSEWIVKLLVIVITVWLIWSVVQPRYVLVIRIHRGRPSVRKGKVTSMFLSRVAAVCQESGVMRGWIGGVRHGKRTALRFSRHFPPGSRQRLRNEWALAS